MKTRLVLTLLCFHTVLFKAQEQAANLELPVCPARSSEKTWPIAVEINKVPVFCAPGNVVFCMQTQATQEVRRYSIAKQQKKPNKTKEK